MKINKLFALLLLTAFTWQGCNKTDDPKMGTIDFGLNPTTEKALNSLITSQYDVDGALISIVNEYGEKIYNKEYLEFYKFGENFVTKSLSLNVGKYKLTEFMLVDSSGTVIYATPVEDSDLGDLVNDPLPIEFSVIDGNTTHLNPEVLSIGAHNPNDFGYVNFNVIFVDNFCLAVHYESACSDWNGDSSIIFMDGIRAPIYPARVEIYTGDKMISETYIFTGDNQLAIPRGYKTYKIIVYDCGNQQCFKENFTSEELENLSCGGDNYLNIRCGVDYPEVIITPENIMEATIEQGIFGKITQAVGDSTNYQENQVKPMITNLYLYKMLDMESYFIPGDGPDCIVYPDINIEPIAIVRSNSSGYYQLPLEQGNYNYMVETPFGYYIDAFVSSHLPGQVEVIQGEVTTLNIYVSPCLWY